VTQLGGGPYGVVELIRSATVVMTAVRNGAREQVGSGFFVAPGRVATCAHVLFSGSDPKVLWRGNELPPTAKVSQPVAPPASGHSYEAPDAAILTIDLADHPCVPLAQAGLLPATNDPVYLRGISDVRRPGSYEPYGAICNFVSVEADGLAKLSGDDLVAPGMSGGPVLDLKARAVCAMTRQRLSQKPGIAWATPLDDVLAVSHEDLRAQNEQYFPTSLQALRAAQHAFGSLPIMVSRMLDEQAWGLLELHLNQQLDLEAPVEVASKDKPEWIARQLFMLDVDELVGAIRATTTKDYVRIFEAVACCLPVGESPVAWWVPADAAERLRDEYHKPAPRLVRVGTDMDLTTRLLLWRALERSITLRACAGTDSAEKDATTGLPVTLVSDLTSKISQLAGRLVTLGDEPQADWEELVQAYATALDKRGTVLRLDLAGLDRDLLERLLKWYGGLRFLVARREVAVPADSDDVLLDLRPPIDAALEGAGLGALDDLLPNSPP
jgi:Trypsin-like peptidase domain